jgi:hypothetical protein
VDLLNTLIGLVLAAVTLAALAFAGGQEGLPLRHGDYVEAQTPCQGAPSSSRLWFGGGFVLHAPHTHCEARRHHRTGPSAYDVALRCYEQGDRDAPFDRLDHVVIAGRTDFTLANDFGRGRYRWCGT